MPREKNCISHLFITADAVGYWLFVVAVVVVVFLDNWACDTYTSRYRVIQSRVQNRMFDCSNFLGEFDYVRLPNSIN